MNQPTLACITIVDLDVGRVGEDGISIVLGDALVVEADVEGNGGALEIVSAQLIRTFIIIFVFIVDILNGHGRTQHREGWRAEIRIHIHTLDLLPHVRRVADAARLVPTSA